MREHASEGDGRTDQGVQFFITANSKLQMSRSDTLDFEILRGVSSKLKNFGCKVFEDGSDIDSG